MSGHSIIDKSEVSFLNRSKMRRKMHNGKIQVGIGEGRLSLSKKGLQLFSSSMPGVLIPVIKSNRKKHYLDSWIRSRFFQDFEKVGSISSRIAI